MLEELTAEALKALPDDFLCLINESIESYVYWEISEVHQRHSGCVFINPDDDNYDTWAEIDRQWKLVQDELQARNIAVIKGPPPNFCGETINWAV